MSGQDSDLRTNDSSGRGIGKFGVNDSIKTSDINSDSLMMS